MPAKNTVKTILNKTKRRDPWFLDDYTVNPYSACSFNCLFCYIRGSKYGTQMEQKLSVKINAAELLDKQLALRAKKNQYGIIVLSSATDPYLQFEKEEKKTRRLLEIILQHRFPVHIITRSDLVQRDFDLLREIDRTAILPLDLQGKLTRKAMVTFSFSSLSDKAAHIFEPGATMPSERLLALQASKKTGLLSGVSLMPLLPWISDTAEELENSFRVFASVPVDYIFPASLTLFGEGKSDSKTLVLEAVRKHYPQLVKKYEDYFLRDSGVPAYYQEALQKKTKSLCEKYKLRNRITGL